MAFVKHGVVAFYFFKETSIFWLASYSVVTGEYYIRLNLTFVISVSHKLPLRLTTLIHHNIEFFAPGFEFALPIIKRTTWYHYQVGSVGYAFFVQVSQK